MKIAIVGAGIAGLACARELARRHEVVLYEAARRAGGHANTVDVTLEGRSHPVDTGFLVFNHRTYPKLRQLFDDLKVPTAPTEMSFSVSVADGRDRLEWAGTNLSTVFAQRRNLASPRFLRMLGELLRFNRHARAVGAGQRSADGLTLGEFLDRHRYGDALRHWYLLPMAAAIWSSPIEATLQHPFETFARFCANHGLLQVNGRPPWYTVPGGSRQYVDAIVSRLPDVRLGDPVQRVEPLAAGGVRLVARHGVAHFDHVVLASHSNQSLALLAPGAREQRQVLAAVGYQSNRALLHTDVALMPQCRSVWSAWNYQSSGSAEPRVAVTYLLNRLQPLPFRTPLLLSLNPIREPDPASVIDQFEYEHPLLDAAAVVAQRELPQVQGMGGVWLAGAWTGHGFHEDGLASGLSVAAAIQSLGVPEERDASRLAA
ncbi:MAG TPA: FAD-dependent oxidoreductase [Burkholderiaceae bacterium]|nr:FAD-dependent oxidoreductase [Burkholderiaceae bacterium]